jgi:hypothetical protein
MVEAVMGYNKFIYMDIGFKFLIEGGFDSKIVEIDSLILALEYVHIARHSYY